MTQSESTPVVRRAANAFVLLALLLAFRLAVATVFAASLPGPMLTSMIAVMIVADLVAVLLWLGIARRSNIARWIACLFVTIVALGSAGDLATYSSRMDRVALDSPLAFNGITGGFMLLAALVALVILLRVDTREAFSAPAIQR